MNRPDFYTRNKQLALLMLLAFLLVGSVQAEWVKLGRSDIFRIYVEQTSIQKNGDLAQMWQLMDFTTAQWVDAQTAVGSIKSLIEYDCSQPRFRTLGSEAYSEQMGGGRVVANEPSTNPQWETIEPDSTPEKMRQIACRKK